MKRGWTSWALSVVNPQIVCDLLTLTTKYFECKNSLGHIYFSFFKRLKLGNWEAKILDNPCHQHREQQRVLGLGGII